MKVNIKSAMEEQTKISELLQEDLDSLLKVEEELQNDPKIQKYLDTEKQIDEILSIRERIFAEYVKNLQANCSHPLWVTVPADKYNFVFNDRSSPCKCAICGANDELLQKSYSKLYKERRLIAKWETNPDAYDLQNCDVFHPIASIEEVRSYYLSAYTLRESLKDNPAVEFAPSPEEMTFDYFVNRTKGKNKQKSIGAKIPAK